MSWYYVKSGGTASGASEDASGSDGIATSQLTGAWSGTASEYFNDLNAASEATLTPGNGDVIVVSSAHSYTDSGTGACNLNGGSASGTGLIVVSADDSNRENYLPGASETWSNSQYLYTYYNVLFAGVSITGEANPHIEIDLDSNITFQDLTLKGGTGLGEDIIKMSVDGANLTLKNVILNGRNVASAINIGNGSKMTWYGGSVAGSTLTGLFDLTGNGGSFIKLFGVDLSGVSGLVVTPTSSDDNFDIMLQNCTTRAALSMPVPTDDGQIFSMFNCDDTTDDDYHRFYYATGNGSAENNDAVYVTNTETWYEGTDKSSIKVITKSTTSAIKPFIFELPAQYVDLGDVSTDTLTLDMVANVTLTDADIAAYLVYPDGTTMVTPRIEVSGSPVTGSNAIDPYSAGSTLATSALGAGDWTGEPASPNFYELVLDTSGTAGEATVVSVRIEVTKASIDGTTNVLYIHPLLTVSAT